MEDTYRFTLSWQDRWLFTAWNRMNPPDDWKRNQRIAGIQGNRNPFVD